MGRYTIRRLLQIIPVFIGATFIVYAMVFAIPGDPVRALFGERQVSPGTVAVIREQYNLNDPLIIQYLKYMGGVFTGDLGTSFRGREVSEIIAQKFPVTLRLAVAVLVIETIIGIAAGILAGLRKGSFIDNLVLVTTVGIVSIPVFVLGFLAQIVFGVELGLLPISGLNAGWQSYILPASVIAILSLCYVARLTRTSLVENLSSDYVRTATAKGMPRRRVVGRHALRNSLIPVVTFLGVDLAATMQGAIITEGIFNLPGIGGEVFNAVKSQENSVVVGIVIVLLLVFILANLLVDLLYAVLDPRIRYE